MRTPAGGYALAVFSEDGEILYQTPLPDRGHAIAFDHNSMQLLSFARRPENFAVLVDLTGAREPVVFTSPEGRHFYGHGVFSPDGQLAYAPENDFENVRGVIGVYDLTGAQPARIGEFDSFGVGPHDLLLSPDGTQLVVANGGIETHPDKGREKLNLDSMKPSVSFISTANGDFLGMQTLGANLHQLSLRHMSYDGNGDVWVGGQFRRQGCNTTADGASGARQASNCAGVACGDHTGPAELCGQREDEQVRRRDRSFMPPWWQDSVLGRGKAFADRVPSGCRWLRCGPSG